MEDLIIVDAILDYLRYCASNITDMPQIELEACCQMLSYCIPLLIRVNIDPSLFDELISLGLKSPSHFVRAAAVDAIRSWSSVPEASLHSVSRLVVALSSEPSTTLFNVLTAIMHCGRVDVLMFCDNAVENLWFALESSDVLLAESARCCIRSAIFSECGTDILRESPSDVVKRLEGVVLRSLRLDTGSGVCSALALFDLRFRGESKLGILYTRWCRDWLERILHWLSHSDSDPLASIATTRWILVLDLVHTMVLKDVHALSHCESTVALLISTTSRLLHAALVDRLMHPPVWKLWNKFSKMLLCFPFTITGAALAALPPFFKAGLQSALVPTPTKVGILSAISALAAFRLCNTSLVADWTFFDTLEPELQASRFAQAWEVRDSVLLVFARVLKDCIDIDGALKRSIHIGLTLGLRDANESVRATSLDAISALASDVLVWQCLLSSEPNLVLRIFCVSEDQTNCRLAQSTCVAQLLKYSHVEASLPTTEASFVSGFASTINLAAHDDDWDVRSSVADVMESLLRLEASRKTLFWTGLRCPDLLQQLVQDESRMVRKRAWKLIADNMSHSEISALKLTSGAGGLEQVSRALSELEVDANYDPDDEVYPLSPGVAENDIDCPF